MEALLDGTQTRGMKGMPYDWQALLIPVEPVFSEELDSLLDSVLTNELAADAGL